MNMFKKNGGFTLVELIVVIAILAILAGVAVPAYSGYIAKAETAADLQLLAAINDAFAGSVVASRMEMANVNSAALTWSGKSITGVASVNGAANSKVSENFAMLYAGNQTTQFKRIESLVFDAGLKVFVDPATASSITVNYKGSNITVSGSALKDLNNSTFGTIGSNALLDQIGAVTGAAAIMADSLSGVFKDESFLGFAMAALDAANEDEYEAKAGAIIEQLMEKNDMTYDEAAAQLQANAAVLYASKHAVEYTDEQIADLFAGGSANVKNNLKGADAANGMAQAALIYGMYTAYANSAEYGNDELIEKSKNPLTVLNAMDKDENFKAYINSAQGKTDLEAYQGAPGVIVESTQNNESATTDLMINGFNNDELKGIMGGLIG